MAGKGKEAFINHYQSLFGDRTPGLLAALEVAHLPVFFVKEEKREELQETWQRFGFSWKELPWFPQAIQWPDDVPFGKKMPGSQEGWLYPLSPSSLIPIVALEVQSSNQVLDACAAPGGKTLALAKQLHNPATQLIANDVSSDRVVRLRRVLRDFSLGEVEVRFGPAEYVARRFPESFDRILVDAPCSSEAHVWRSPDHLSQWTHKRIEQLHDRQFNLVTSLMAALKPGGRLVYSTCALTPEENEQVVNRVLEQTPRVQLVSLTHVPGHEGMAGYGEITTKVRRVWPDTDTMEPMFMAAFEKLA